MSPRSPKALALSRASLGDPRRPGTAFILGPPPPAPRAQLWHPGRPQSASRDPQGRLQPQRPPAERRRPAPWPQGALGKVPARQRVPASFQPWRHHELRQPPQIARPPRARATATPGVPQLRTTEDARPRTPRPHLEGRVGHEAREAPRAVASRGREGGPGRRAPPPLAGLPLPSAPLGSPRFLGSCGTAWPP